MPHPIDFECGAIMNLYLRIIYEIIYKYQIKEHFSSLSNFLSNS